MPTRPCPAMPHRVLVRNVRVGGAGQSPAEEPARLRAENARLLRTERERQVEREMPRRVTRSTVRTAMCWAVSTRTHIRSVSPVIPSSAANAAYAHLPPPARYNAMESFRNSSGYGD